MPDTTIQHDRKRVALYEYASGMREFDRTGFGLMVDNPQQHWKDLERIYPEFKAIGPSGAYRGARQLIVLPVQRMPRSELLLIAASAHVLQVRRQGGVRLDTYPLGPDQQSLVLSELQGGQATVHIYRSNSK